MVGCIGLEPTTPALSRQCSEPTELTSHIFNTDAGKYKRNSLRFYSLTGGGEIMMCARCVPGSIIHGPPGTIGLIGRPVDSAVAKGM